MKWSSHHQTVASTELYTVDRKLNLALQDCVRFVTVHMQPTEKFSCFIAVVINKSLNAIIIVFLFMEYKIPSSRCMHRRANRKTSRVCVNLFMNAAYAIWNVAKIVHGGCIPN